MCSPKQRRIQLVWYKASKKSFVGGQGQKYRRARGQAALYADSGCTLRIASIEADPWVVVSICPSFCRGFSCLLVCCSDLFSMLVCCSICWSLQIDHTCLIKQTDFHSTLYLGHFSLEENNSNGVYRQRRKRHKYCLRSIRVDKVIFFLLISFFSISMPLAARPPTWDWGSRVFGQMT